MKFRTNWEHYEHPGVDFTGDPGLTKQADKEGCDINNIMRRFTEHGVLPEMRDQAEAIYGDFSTPMEFQEAMNIVNAAQLQFENLEAKVRDRFHNDPGTFLAFATDPENQEEMVKLGLAIKKPVAEPKTEKTPAGKPDGGQA